MWTWVSRLPQVICLEDWLDRPTAWIARREMASDGGLHIQPMVATKDNWERCLCEGAYDLVETEDGAEYIRCPSHGAWGNECRQDWRPGRELSEEQATRWALSHGATAAHHILNGPERENASAALPASDTRRTVDNLELTDWQQDFLERSLRTDRIDTGGLRPRGLASNTTWSGHRGVDDWPESTVLGYEPPADINGRGTGALFARRGSRYVCMDVSPELMEDPIAADHACRTILRQLDDDFERERRRQSSGDHREGQAGS